MKLFLTVCFLIAPFICFSQDTHKQSKLTVTAVNDTLVTTKDSAAAISGMYKSNAYKRDFYVFEDNSNDTVLFHGKPRNICDFIYFFPDSNKILYDAEAWGSCSRVYRKDMFSDPRMCWVGQGEYEISGDSIKIYGGYAAARKLLYSGVMKDGKMTLWRYNATIVYTQSYPLVFEQCLECK